jgi:hypothetical protein
MYKLYLRLTDNLDKRSRERAYRQFTKLFCVYSIENLGNGMFQSSTLTEQALNNFVYVYWSLNPQSNSTVTKIYQQCRRSSCLLKNLVALEIYEVFELAGKDKSNLDMFNCRETPDNKVEMLIVRVNNLETTIWMRLKSHLESYFTILRPDFIAML